MTIDHLLAGRTPPFTEGDAVEKTGGDYYFRGTVVSAFRKTSGLKRYVVENTDGVLHIFNGDQLRLVPQPEKTA